MGRRRWLALICLAGAVIVLVWYFLIRADPVAEEVDRLVATMPTRGRQVTLNDLWARGPGVIPHLARNARRQDTFFFEAYRFIWRKLPNRAQALFKPPRSVAAIRASAMEAIAALGPLAAYRAEQTVIEAMADPVQTVRWHAQYAIEWLVPESLQALKVYAQVLADTNRPVPIHDLNVSETIWPKTPSLVALLSRRLVQPEHAQLAAMALGYAGSNAISAIPSLIEIVDYGFAAPLGESDFRTIYTALDRNRAAAVQALGRIGVAAPEVISALARAWNSTNSWVRESAANAIGMLAANITAMPPDLIGGLEERDNRALSAKLDAISRIGPSACGALEMVEKLTNTNYVRKGVKEPFEKTIPLRVQDIATAARVAICRIDPKRCPALLPELAGQIGQSSAVNEFMKGLRTYSNEVIRAAEPWLRTTNEPHRSSWAAHIILKHDPTHSEAIGVLQRNKRQGPLNDRMLAAERLFDATGDTNGVWQLIEEGLSPASLLGQWAVDFAGKLGPPAIPILRRSLWHKDHFVRTRAGLSLRKLNLEKPGFASDHARHSQFTPAQ